MVKNTLVFSFVLLLLSSVLAVRPSTASDDTADSGSYAATTGCMDIKVSCPKYVIQDPKFPGKAGHAMRIEIPDIVIKRHSPPAWGGMVDKVSKFVGTNGDIAQVLNTVMTAAPGALEVVAGAAGTYLPFVNIGMEVMGLMANWAYDKYAGCGDVQFETCGGKGEFTGLFPPYTMDSNAYLMALISEKRIPATDVHYWLKNQKKAPPGSALEGLMACLKLRLTNITSGPTHVGYIPKGEDLLFRQCFRLLCDIDDIPVNLQTAFKMMTPKEDIGLFMTTKVKGGVDCATVPSSQIP